MWLGKSTTVSSPNPNPNPNPNPQSLTLTPILHIYYPPPSYAFLPFTLNFTVTRTHIFLSLSEAVDVESNIRSEQAAGLPPNQSKASYSEKLKVQRGYGFVLGLGLGVGGIRVR